MFSCPECIIWLAVGLTESVAIVTLNIITIIVFIKNRNIRKRSTYLIINLSAVDMLVGGSALHALFYLVGVEYNIWKYHLTEYWAIIVIFTLLDLFSLSSLINITAISVERLHATLRPFRHRVINKLFYVLATASVWFTAALLSIAARVLEQFKGENHYVNLLNSFIATCLLVICVSYTCIFIKFRWGAKPQHHGAANRERKLTTTLLLVTVISLLLYLPYVIFNFIDSRTEITNSVSKVTYERLHHVLSVLYFANSLVNPILYAVRMPEYRSAVLALFRRRHLQQRPGETFPSASEHVMETIPSTVPAYQNVTLLKYNFKLMSTATETSLY